MPTNTEADVHPAVGRFVQEQIERLRLGSVLEIGSLDVNGSVRHLFPWAVPYVGLDIKDGPGVDIVADATRWVPDRAYDVVVCLEVLEHVRSWRAVVNTCCEALAPGGTLLLTCATDGRGPHDAHGAPEFPEGQYYKNVPMQRFADAVEGRFQEYELRRTVGSDLQFRGVKVDLAGWEDNPNVRWRYP